MKRLGWLICSVFFYAVAVAACLGVQWLHGSQAGPRWMYVPGEGIVSVGPGVALVAIVTAGLSSVGFVISVAHLFGNSGK